MADPKMTIQIGAEEKELVASLARSTAQIKDFANQSKSAAEKAAINWEQSSRRIGASLLAMSTGLAGSLGAIGAEGAKFEAAMRYVNSNARLSETQFKSLEKQVIALSQSMNTDKGPTEMAKGLYDIVGAGFQGEKAMAILKVSTMAATAGMTDLSTASKAVTTVMAAFQLPAEKAALVGDILAVSAEKGRLHLSELAQSIGPAATKAAAFGVSLEEVGASMSILARTMPATEASTALEKLITQLAAPTEKSAKALASLGVETGKVALQKKGLVGVIRELVEASKGDDQTLRRALSTSEGLTAAFNLAAGGGKDFLAVLEDMQHSSGHLADANNEVMKSTIAQWGKLKKEIEIGAISMRDSLLPVAGSFLKMGDEAVKAFNAATPAQKAFVAQSALVAAGITGIGGAAFLALPQLVALGTLLGGPVVVGLGLLTAAGVTWAGAWAGNLGRVRLDTQEFVSNMKGYFSDFSSWLKNLKLEVHVVQKFISDLHPQDKAFQDAYTANFNKAQAANSPFGPAGSDPNKQADAERRARLGSGLTNPVAYGFVGPMLTSAQIIARSSATFAQSATELAKNAAGTYTYGPERATAPPGSMAAKKAKKAKGKKPSAEDVARGRLTSSAESLVGRSLSDIPRFSGALGDIAVKNADTSNKCADTVRQVAQLAGVKFGLTGVAGAADSAVLRRLGLGVGADNADSFPGKMISASQVKAGDLALFKNTDPKYAGTGAVTHVGIVIDPVKGLMVDASSSTGVVKKRAISTFKPSELFGFMRPQALEELAGKGAGGSGVENFAEASKQAKELRDKFLGFVSDDYTKTVAELGKQYEEALASAQSPDDAAKIKAAYQDKLGRLQTEQTQGLQAGNITRDVFAQGVDDSQKEFDHKAALINAMSEATRAQIDEKRALEMSATAARIEEIGQELQSDLLADQTRADLTVKQKQLEAELDNQRRTFSSDRQARTLADADFDRQMGTLSTKDYLQVLTQQLADFQGSEDQKRALQLQTHQLALQQDQERAASADAISNSLNNSLATFLQSSLSGSQSFGDAFKGLWKGVMNSIIQMIAQAIVKALALQVIMKGIFGFFGGIFGGFLGGGGILADTPGLELPGMLTAHTGGMIGPNGQLQSFHSGGLVGGLANFRQDEVLAKLQTGEAVLSRRQLSNLQNSSATSDPSGAGITQHIYITGNSTDPQGIARAIAQETKWRLQGVA